jgi:hypothetical protein
MPPQVHANSQDVAGKSEARTRRRLASAVQVKPFFKYVPHTPIFYRRK